MQKPASLLTAALVLSSLLAGCATVEPSKSAMPDFGVPETTLVEATPASLEAPEPGPATVVTLHAEPTLASPSGLLPAAPEDDGLHGNRWTLKTGYYSSEDADALDDGYIITGSWTRFLSKLLAIEFETGYIESDGSDGGVSGDLWAVPLMLNGRVNLPIWVVEAYGGVGLGGFYYDLEVGPAEDDGFLWGGNAFLGGSVNLGDSLALGLEGKYYFTEESDVNASLDSFAVLLTLGFAR